MTAVELRIVVTAPTVEEAQARAAAAVTPSRLPALRALSQTRSGHGWFGPAYVCVRVDEGVDLTDHTTQEGHP